MEVAFSFLKYDLAPAKCVAYLIHRYVEPFRELSVSFDSIAKTANLMKILVFISDF